MLRRFEKLLNFAIKTLNVFLCLECSPNEVFVECDASCQPICDFGYNDTKIFDCGCVHGCVCKPVLIRSLLTKKCISIKKCNQILFESKESRQCSENEVFSETKAACQPSCFTRKFTGSGKCPVLAGCVCRKGFVLDVTFGIPVEKCPSK